jgi:hypothetical protein
MMRKTFIALLMIGLVWASTAIYAQDAAVHASLMADRSELTVGDVIQLTLSVTHPAGYRVALPEIGQTWGDFDVRNIGQPGISAAADGEQITTINIKATLFTTGVHATPIMELTVYDTSGQATPLTVEPISYTVNSVLQEGDTTLRDIRGQADLPLPQASPITPSRIALAAVVVALGAVAVYYYLAARRMNKPIVDLREPYEIARDELTRIQSLDLIAQGTFTEYYNLVSQCIRRYAQTELRLPAMERTTAELKTIVRDSDLTSQQARDLLSILTECDFVKFGGVLPDEQSAQRLMVEVALFVDNTRRRAEMPAMIAERGSA